MSIKDRIHKDLQSESTGMTYPYALPGSKDTNTWQADTVGSMINDSNHVMRRFFRCYLDGSYGNQEDYTRNCEYLRECDTYTPFGRSNDAKRKKIRSFVIMRFTSYIATEYDCHYSTAQKAITSAFSKTDLERLTVELIDDALDLIRD